MQRILLFNKPLGVACQFRPLEGHQTLKDYIPFPDVHAAGRLDADSEGLMILTDDGAVQHRLAHPRFKLAKTYLAQVDGAVAPDALNALRQGVDLGDFTTRPADVCIAEPPTWLWPRPVPIRYRKNIPTTWLEITITEGKNRQVRRMSAKVGHPTLRLVRIRIGPFSVQALEPGQWRWEPLPENFFQLRSTQAKAKR